MFSVLPLSLLAIMTVVAGAAALMFWDVAFHKPGATDSRRTAHSGWALPVLRGEELRAWGKRMVDRLVSAYAHQPRTPDATLALAKNISQGVSQVIDDVMTNSPVGSRVIPDCTSRRHEMIGITGLEAIAMAEELWNHREGAEVVDIRDRAIRNAQLARPLTRDSYRSAKITCPLLTDDGQCATYSSRPIYCRSQCRECSGAGCDCAAGDATDAQEFAVTLGGGVLNGLTDGLAAAGMDGQVYELNSALAVALDTPDISTRWGRGEPVFAGCKQVE
jgi:hypothetical protein